MLARLRDYFFSLAAFKRVVLLLTILFFAGAGASFSYAVYAFLQPTLELSSAEGEASGRTVSPIGFFGQAAKERVTPPEGAVRTVPSPLTGVFYTPEEAEVWQARRSLAVMINNHVDARPQWGLSFADIVYEVVAEGGISRFLAIFHTRLPEKVGPVRSARKYYVDFAKEYDAWYAHWGGASTDNEANAYDYMRTIFVSSLDAMWAGDGPNLAFDRDMGRADRVAWEHTGFARPEKLYALAYQRYPDQARGFRPIEAWPFKEDPEEVKRPLSSSAEFNFWDVPGFEVRWEYDPKTNTYSRFQGGQEQTDALTAEPLRARNVVIEFLLETSLRDEKAHLLYKTLGQGEAKVLLDGRVIEASWVRRDLGQRTKYFDRSGAAIAFNRGPTWIEVLPTGNTITYH